MFFLGSRRVYSIKENNFINFGFWNSNLYISTKQPRNYLIHLDENVKKASFHTFYTRMLNLNNTRINICKRSNARLLLLPWWYQEFVSQLYIMEPINWVFILLSSLQIYTNAMFTYMFKIFKHICINIQNIILTINEKFKNV